MNTYRSVFVLLGVAVSAGCDAFEKNTVQELTAPAPTGARIRFFHFGVNAPGVNFYAGDTKMTAIFSATGTEATIGVAYGGVGAGGAYAAIAAGPNTLTGKIAAATDKNLVISTVATTLADGKYYSFYMSGFYDPAAKTVDGFVVEDPLVAPTDYSVAYVRFVHAISNANPMTLYAKNTTTLAEVAVGGAVAYKQAGVFMAVPNGVYDLSTRYTDSTSNAISRTGVSFLGGRIYTIGARGDITITSTTATNRPQLDNTPNR